MLLQAACLQAALTCLALSACHDNTGALLLPDSCCTAELHRDTSTAPEPATTRTTSRGVCVVQYAASAEQPLLGIAVQSKQRLRQTASTERMLFGHSMAAGQASCGRLQCNYCTRWQHTPAPALGNQSLSRCQQAWCPVCGSTAQWTAVARVGR